MNTTPNIAALAGSLTGARVLEAVSQAIVDAGCPGREGPFGGYDYGHNTAFYGPEPEGGRYVIRDFRDPASGTWGKWVHQTADNADHQAKFDELTRHHIAQAAIAAYLKEQSNDGQG